ncbi:MAG: hypothetical protein ACRDNK_07830 [Solirubrobacteraceae bacterium]
MTSPRETTTKPPARRLMSPDTRSESRNPALRRSRAGSLIVEASTLRVGDRVEFSGATRRVWWPITAIEDKPKTRVITLDAGLGQRPAIRLSKTTLVGRAPRESER